MKRLFFWLLMLAVAGGLRGQGPSVTGDPAGAVPFEVNRQFRAILIRVQVNAQPATMVVDTGSSHTILSSELLHVRPPALQHADAPAKGSGYVGKAAWAQATVEVGAFRWTDRKLLVMDDFQEMSNSMSQRVDGILGEDVLTEFDSILIDFKHHRLFLVR